VNVNDFVAGVELGTNNNRSVTINPTTHTVCNQRGVGFRPVGGFGGSFGGPDFAELDRCTEYEYMRRVPLPSRPATRIGGPGLKTTGEIPSGHSVRFCPKDWS